MWAAFQEPTLIRPLRGHRPLKGEGFRAAQCAAPTAGDGPGALVRKRQAQKWNRTSPNFFLLRPPVGPDGTAPKHS